MWQIKTTTDDTMANDKGQASIILDRDKSVSRLIQDNTVVSLYLVTPDTDKVKVTVKDYFDNVYATVYAEPNSAVSVSDNTISIGSATVPVRVSPYYEFTGVDKTSVGTSTTVIKLQGNAKTTEKIYTVTGGTVNGVNELAVSPNQKLAFVAEIDNFFAWIASPTGGSGYNLVSYSPTFTTLAFDYNYSFIAVTKDELSNYFSGQQLEDIANNKLPMSFGVSSGIVNVNGVNKFPLYCNFTIGYENATVVDAGIVFTANASVAGDESQFIKGASNVTTVRSNAINGYNQYSVTKTNASIGQYMRSYVSYEYTTVVNGATVTVPRTEYGPVVAVF